MMREITIAEFDRITHAHPSMPYNTTPQAEAIKTMEVGQAIVLEHEGFECYRDPKPGKPKKRICTLTSLVKRFQYLDDRCKVFRCRHTTRGEVAVQRMPDREPA